MSRPRGFLPLCALIAAAVHTSRAGDWPAYNRDATRNAAAAETLAAPLAQAWVFAAPHAPRPAWPSTARQDIWHELTDLPHVVAYDRVYHTIAAGDRVYFGSSADDKVYALDAGTGEVRWTFFTEGPVRLAPAYAEGRLYAGSDDGCVYCLDAATGALVWKHRAALSARRIPGNGRLISDMPVRAGVLVDGGTVYACAGLFPPKAALACALDARTGAPRWSRLLASVSPQGYLSASPTQLFVPTGRTSPAVLDRAGGEYLGMLEGDGGTEIVLHGGVLFHGPGRQTGEKLAAGDPATLARGGELPCVRAVFAGDIAYVQSKRELSALRHEPYLDHSRRAAQLRAEREKAVEAFKREPEGDRKRTAAARAAELTARIAEAAQAMQQCVVWKHTTACTAALLLAGDTLIAGGDGAVVALDAAGGRVLWTAEVRGCAYGLAVARGRLFASTDKGVIHCFAPAARAAGAHAPAPAPVEVLAPRDAETARRILATSGVTRGWCLVLGSGEGRLIRTLAAASELAVVGLERDPGKVARSRAMLDAAGLYGVRAAVLLWEGDRIPCTDYVADLVVAGEIPPDGMPPAGPDEIIRVTRPAGGIVCVGQTAPPPPGEAALTAAAAGEWLRRAHEVAGWTGGVREEGGVWIVLRRNALAGGGEWTQLYANPGHTAASGDRLDGDLVVQWFGEPGPREMIDRHHRAMSPLVTQGRIMIAADNRVIAVNQYNGSPLWSLDIPESRRVGALKSAGHMLAAGDSLYLILGDKVWTLDAATGARGSVLSMPPACGAGKEWGYLNHAGGVLLGTAQRSGAAFRELSRALIDMLEGDFRVVVVSDALFALDLRDGSPAWTRAGKAFMPSAITAGEDRVYFLESRDPAALGAKDGRLRVDAFLARETFLAAVEAATGAQCWERPVRLPFHHIAYACTAEGLVLLSGSYNKAAALWYGLYAFDAATGAERWQTHFRAMDIRGRGFAETGGTHGEQWQHPVITGGAVYLRPYSFDLASGARRDFTAYRGGHGCGGLTGSLSFLFGRGDVPRMYPLDRGETEGIPLTLVSRPGCWLNIIPAGGLVIIPESSSGCTCPYAIQTSLALVPERAGKD